MNSAVVIDELNKFLKKNNIKTLKKDEVYFAMLMSVEENADNCTCESNKIMKTKDVNDWLEITRIGGPSWVHISGMIANFGPSMVTLWCGPYVNCPTPSLNISYSIIDKLKIK